MTPPVHPVPPPSGSFLLATLNVTNRSINSTFRRTDATCIINEEIRLQNIPKSENEGNDIIIYHPGSRNIRIGLAKDPFPKILTNIISNRIHLKEDQKAERHAFNAFYDIDHGSKLNNMILELLDNKNNYLKRKPIPNATQQMFNFNKNVVPVVIAGHNDAFGVEWTPTAKTQPAFVIGKEALTIHPSDPYDLFYPIHKRHLRLISEKSPSLLIADLEHIIIGACAKELNINETEFNNYCFVLILPDNCSKLECRLWCQIIFELGFKSVLLVQESLASAFGAGIGTCCVVDVGAEQTTIALIEDGYLVPDSRLSLNYGGDHLLPLFLGFIKDFEFPYTEIDLLNNLDYDLLSELKERTCALIESELSVQLIDFYVRQPGKSTLSYQFKSYDERFLTPLALFYPDWLCLKASADVGLEALDDPEDLTFARTWYKLGKTTTGLADSQSELMNVTEDIASEIVTEPTTESVESSLEEIQMNCLWSCSNNFKGNVRQMMNHILIAHDNEKDGKFICHWGLYCQKEFSSYTSFECHLMTHIIDTAHISIKASQIVPELPSQEKTWVGMDEAIYKVITAIESDPEKVKKWLTNILLVGGGHLFAGFKEMLEERLKERAKEYSFGEEERIGYPLTTQTSTSLRDVDPKYVTWKGAAIYARLFEANKDYWITSIEWKQVGMRVINEKYPHLF